jgi:SAM-dependent methyltransferase
VRDRAERLARRVVHSAALLSRRPLVMTVVDAIDRPFSLPFREFRDLPPNHLRIRAGVGNRLLFNQAQFLEYGANALVGLIDKGIVGLDSRIVDVGCGCGRFAHALRRYGYAGEYAGIDVDAEAIEWCRRAYPGDRFRFHHADVYSSIYNPGGRPNGAYRLPVEDGSQDFVLGQSVLTHLLEDDVANYLAEAHRVLRPGGYVWMGVFCREYMDDLGLLGGRWTFERRIGNAYVESEEHPEAAVCYERDFLEGLARTAGFAEIELLPGVPQSALKLRR